jgi:hypothetical protein
VHTHTAIAAITSFPKTENEFRIVFPDEKRCVAYLFSTKWPHGFECPNCRMRNPSITPKKSITCPRCGTHTSLTTDTVMHGTKKKLCSWLLAIWWLCINESGASAKDLQRLLQLSSYQTAWTWMQKLRMVMAAADNIPCKGLIELGSAKVAPAWEKPGRARVIAAAETLLPSGITGRIRMKVIDSLSVTNVTLFIQNTIQSGSSIVAPGLKPYAEADKYGSSYVIDSPSKNPERISEIISSFEIWLNKVHRGGVAIKHLQHYLDEFCFRNNSAILPDRQSVFRALLKGCMAGKTMPYRELVGEQ